VRLFASVEPSPQALAHLGAAVGAVRGPWSGRGGVRWVDPEQWHVTVAFYGEVPDGAVPGLTGALAERVGPLRVPRLRLRGAGSFSGRNLWVGVVGESEDDERALSALVAGCLAAGADVGLPPEPRPRNRAHVTLARVGGRRPEGRRGGAADDVADTVRALAVYAGPAWRATQVLLVRSQLGAGRGGGPLHEVVAGLALRGPA
jgi:2'-5' RNA ligase